MQNLDASSIVELRFEEMALAPYISPNKLSMSIHTHPCQEDAGIFEKLLTLMEVSQFIAYVCMPYRNPVCGDP